MFHFLKKKRFIRAFPNTYLKHPKSQWLGLLRKFWMPYSITWKTIQTHCAQLAHALQRQPIFLQLLMALLPKSSSSAATVALLHESRQDLATFAGTECVSHSCQWESPESSWPTPASIYSVILMCWGEEVMIWIPTKTNWKKQRKMRFIFI